MKSRMILWISLFGPILACSSREQQAAKRDDGHASSAEVVAKNRPILERPAGLGSKPKTSPRVTADALERLGFSTAVVPRNYPDPEPYSIGKIKVGTLLPALGLDPNQFVRERMADSRKDLCVLVEGGRCTISYPGPKASIYDVEDEVGAYFDLDGPAPKRFVTGRYLAGKGFRQREPGGNVYETKAIRFGELLDVIDIENQLFAPVQGEYSMNVGFWVNFNGGYACVHLVKHAAQDHGVGGKKPTLEYTGRVDGDAEVEAWLSLYSQP